ncbi:hypothetical protein [Chryseobacterium indoltheticum]|uniref:hypothetical protein n=1 Tax=Chryseobacterium indoltheticum TaxID=254 RepID=UPI003F499F03
MRSIFNAAENVFGQHSAKYKEFGNALISQQSDAELVRVAKIMSLTAERNTFPSFQMKVLRQTKSIR